MTPARRYTLCAAVPQAHSKRTGRTANSLLPAHSTQRHNRAHPTRHVLAHAPQHDNAQTPPRIAVIDPPVVPPCGVLSFFRPHITAPQLDAHTPQQPGTQQQRSVRCGVCVVAPVRSAAQPPACLAPPPEAVAAAGACWRCTPG
jgi:hypothetical protein